MTFDFMNCYGLQKIDQVTVKNLSNCVSRSEANSKNLVINGK